MSKAVSVSFSVYSIAGETYAPEERPVQVDFTIHLSEETTNPYNYSSSILGTQGFNFSLEEAEELVVLLQKAVHDSKAMNLVATR